MSGRERIDVQTVNGFVQGTIPSLGIVKSLYKFPDGQSNPTFRLETTSGIYVLRCQPQGKLLKSAHAVEREYRVLKFLKTSSVPVPLTYVLCEDVSIIGRKFFIMEYVDGRIFWNPCICEVGNDERTAIFDSMNQVLTDLHKVDISGDELKGFGGIDNFLVRQIDLWTKQYRASETQVIPEMEQLAAWLPSNVPKEDKRVSLIHGDFRLDNMIIAHDSSRVVALLDWELSTVGHPVTDLAYQCMQWRFAEEWPLPGLGTLDRRRLGIPTEEEYMRAYCERMGLDGISNWTFFLVLSFFRIASIIQGVKKRSLDGTASSRRAGEIGSMVQPLAAMACQILD